MTKIKLTKDGIEVRGKAHEQEDIAFHRSSYVRDMEMLGITEIEGKNLYDLRHNIHLKYKEKFGDSYTKGWF